MHSSDSVGIFPHRFNSFFELREVLIVVRARQAFEAGCAAAAGPHSRAAAGESRAVGGAAWDAVRTRARSCALERAGDLRAFFERLDAGSFTDAF